MSEINTFNKRIFIEDRFNAEYVTFTDENGQTRRYYNNSLGKNFYYEYKKNEYSIKTLTNINRIQQELYAVIRKITEKLLELAKNENYSWSVFTNTNATDRDNKINKIQDGVRKDKNNYLTEKDLFIQKPDQWEETYNPQKDSTLTSIFDGKKAEDVFQMMGLQEFFPNIFDSTNKKLNVNAYINPLTDSKYLPNPDLETVTGETGQALILFPMLGVVNPQPEEKAMLLRARTDKMKKDINNISKSIEIRTSEVTEAQDFVTDKMKQVRDLVNSLLSGM